MLKKGALIILSICFCLLLSVTVFAEFSELKPSQAKDVSAVLKNDGTVVLTWQDALYADGYNLEKSFDGIEYEIVAKGISKTEYVDSTKTGHRYYRVTPYNENGNGIQSKVVARSNLRRAIEFASEREFVDAVGIDNYLYAVGAGDNILTVFKLEDDEVTVVSDIINERKFKPELLYANGDYLYIASRIPRGGYNVAVYSVKDRENPVFKKAVSAAQIKHFCQAGNYLFGAAGSSGVAVFDIKEPDKISLDTYIPIEGSVNACYANGNILYVATANGIIKGYNITNVKAAFGYRGLKYDFTTYLWQQTYADNWTGERGGFVRAYPFTSNFRDLFVKNGLLYAGGDHGVKIADFTSYKKPEYLTPKDKTFRTESSASELILDGDLLYSIGARNFRVYNIQNPKEAIKAGIYYPFIKVDIAGVYMMDDKLAVVNKNGFITIYNK